MGFFAEMSAWLDELLASYISENAARVATALEPLVASLAIVYVMVWGYLHLIGKVDEPFLQGAKRIVTLALILGVSLQLWAYNEVLVDTFFQVSSRLAAAIVGTFDYVGVIDEILFRGDEAGTLLVQRGGIFKGNFSFYLAGCAVYLLVGLTALYTIFLLSLSRIALSVLLAIGPFFVAMLLFDSTKRFVESWLAQLANYALITVLSVLAAALMMRLVTVATADALGAGGGIEIAHALRVCMAAGLTLLVMRQVMPMAAGLASGLALSTFGLVSAGVKWGLGKSSHGMGQFARGLSDTQTTRWDSLSRKAGYMVRQGVAASARAVGRRENLIRRSW